MARNNKKDKNLLDQFADLLNGKADVHPLISITLKLIPIIGGTIAILGLVLNKIDYATFNLNNILGLIIVSNLILISGFFFLLPARKLEGINYNDIREGFETIIRGQGFQSDDVIKRSIDCTNYLIRTWLYLLLSVWALYYFIEMINHALYGIDQIHGIFIKPEFEEFFFNFLNSIESIAYLGIVIVLSCPTYNMQDKKIELPKIFYGTIVCFVFFIIIDGIIKFGFGSEGPIIHTSTNTVGGIVTCILLALLVGKLGNYPFYSRIRYLAIIYGYAGIQVIYPYYMTTKGDNLQIEAIIYFLALCGKFMLLTLLLKNIKSNNFYYYLIFMSEIRYKPIE